MEIEEYKNRFEKEKVKEGKKREPSLRSVQIKGQVLLDLAHGYWHRGDERYDEYVITISELDVLFEVLHRLGYETVPVSFKSLDYLRKEVDFNIFVIKAP